MSNLSIVQKLRLAGSAVKAPGSAFASNVKKARNSNLQAQAGAARRLSKAKLVKAVVEETGNDIREACTVRKQSKLNLQAKNEARAVFKAFRKNQPIPFSRHIDKLYEIAAKQVSDPTSDHHAKTEDQYVRDELNKYLHRPGMQSMDFDHFEANRCKETIEDRLNGSDADRHKMQQTVGRNVEAFRAVIEPHVKAQQDKIAEEIDKDLKAIYAKKPRGYPLPPLEAAAGSAVNQFGLGNINYFLQDVRTLYKSAELYCDIMGREAEVNGTNKKYDLEEVVVSALEEALHKLPDDSLAKLNAQANTDFMIRNSEYRKFQTAGEIPAMPCLCTILS